MKSAIPAIFGFIGNYSYMAPPEFIRFLLSNSIFGREAPEYRFWCTRFLMRCYLFRIACPSCMQCSFVFIFGWNKETRITFLLPSHLHPSHLHRFNREEGEEIERKRSVAGITI
jgi:hypothetical protein